MSSFDTWVIVLEFGGQSVKSARVNSKGTLKGPFSFKLNQARPPTLEEFLRRLADIMQKAKGEESISAVGIGAPSPYEPKTLTFHLSQKPSYEHINGKSLISAILENSGCERCYIENDAVVAARGDIWQGKHMSSRGRYMFLTLGTGLGGCYILDGEIVRGEEIGATRSGEIWNYQFQGENLENAAGTTKAMVRIYRDLGGEDLKVIAGDIKRLARMANKGEQLAVDSFRKFGKLLGKGLSELVLEFKAEAVVLSGNIAYAYALFEKEANNHLSGSRFLKSDLISKGGLLGAANIAFRNIQLKG